MYRLSLLFVCVGMLLLVGCAEKPSPAQSTVRRAEEFRSQDRISDAIRLYKKAIEIDPAYDDPYLQLALIYDDTIEDKQQAVEWYQRFIDVTTNDDMRDRVRNWMESARRAAHDLADVTRPDFADIAPNTQAIIDETVERNRAQMQREFAAKEAALSARFENDIKELRANVQRLTQENRTLRETLEEVEHERDALQVTAPRRPAQEELASLLTTPGLGDDVRTLRTRLAEMAQEKDTLQQTVQEQSRTLENLEAQVVRAQQDAAAARELERVLNVNARLRRQLEETEETKAELHDRIALLEKSVDMADHARIAAQRASDEREIARLQQRVVELEQSLTTAETRKQQAENLLAELQEQTDAVLTSQHAEPSDILREQNRQLRLQVASLTESFNAETTRRAAMERDMRDLERKVHTATNMPPATHTILASDEFRDLSEEITGMQTTIEQQRALLAQRDEQITELTRAARRDEETTTASARQQQLIEELNRQLQSRESRISRLESDLASARMTEPGQTERIRELENQLRRKDTELQEVRMEQKDIEASIRQYEDSLTAAQRERDAAQQQARQYAAALADIRARGPQQLVSAPPPRTPQADVRPVTPTPTPRPPPTATPPRVTVPTAPTATPPPRTAPASVQRPSLPGARPRPRTYRVREGDTLASIAQNLYGDRNRWRDIFAANRDILPRSNSLQVGQELYIPPE